jgi:hypothetical protein
MTLAIVNVLPDPVTGRITCSRTNSAHRAVRLAEQDGQNAEILAVFPALSRFSRTGTERCRVHCRNSGRKEPGASPRSEACRTNVYPRYCPKSSVTRSTRSFGLNQM